MRRRTRAALEGYAALDGRLLGVADFSQRGRSCPAASGGKPYTTHDATSACEEVIVSKALTQAQVSAMVAEAVAAALRAQAGATTPAASKPARKTRAKSGAETHFASLAGATPVRTGKGAKFTITLGDLTFACENRNGKVFAHTTNGAGDERWIVMKPSTPDALNAGQYLAVVARRYGLVK